MARLRAWLPWGLAVALGALLGAGVYTADYAEGLAYLSNDPAACSNCHVMDDAYDSWLKSSHHAVATCNDCHVPHAFPEKYLAKARNGWNHSRAFTAQDFPEPIRITSPNLADLQHNCVHCHAALVSEVAGHAEVSRGEARCSDCHPNVGHMARL
jgi:cytochrome c nitrite reductase small subunit